MRKVMMTAAAAAASPPRIDSLFFLLRSATSAAEALGYLFCLVRPPLLCVALVVVAATGGSNRMRSSTGRQWWPLLDLDIKQLLTGKNDYTLLGALPTLKTYHKSSHYFQGTGTVLCVTLFAARAVVRAGGAPVFLPMLIDRLEERSLFQRADAPPSKHGTIIRMRMSWTLNPES